jgi:hypothetical protein
LEAGLLVRYTPEPDFWGTDGFIYSVLGPDGHRRSAAVTVQVEPVNDPPVVVDTTVGVAEDASVTVDLMELAADADGDRIDLAWATQGAEGSVEILDEGTVRYRPAPDFAGPDGFTFEICDEHGACAVGTVDVRVEPRHDLVLAAPGDVVAVLPNDPEAGANLVTGAVSRVVDVVAIPVACLSIAVLASMVWGLGPLPNPTLQPTIPGGSKPAGD